MTSIPDPTPPTALPPAPTRPWYRKRRYMFIGAATAVLAIGALAPADDDESAVSTVSEATATTEAPSPPTASPSVTEAESPPSTPAPTAPPSTMSDAEIETMARRLTVKMQLGDMLPNLWDATDAEVDNLGAIACELAEVVTTPLGLLEAAEGITSTSGLSQEESIVAFATLTVLYCEDEHNRIRALG